MAAALSTTLRAALPLRPAARSERLRLDGGEALVGGLDGDAERLEQRAQGVGLGEGGAGRGPDRPERLSGRPTTTVDGLDLADGLDDGRAVTFGVTAALDRPPRAGQGAPTVAVGDADAPGPEVEARPPGPGRARRPGVTPRSRRRGAAAPRPERRRGGRGPSRRPAPPRPSRRLRRRPSCPSCLTSSTASGVPPVATAIDTLAPSAEPPSTTARTPSWRRIASASDWSSCLRPCRAGPRRCRRRPRRPRQRLGFGLARLLAQRRQLLLGLALALAQPGDRSQQVVRFGAQQLGRRRDQALPLDGPLERRLAVTAKRRRVFEPMEPSESKVIGPIWPSESTWVPPQNSNDAGPACTTRTDVAVLVAEERDGAHVLGLLARRLGRLDADVGQDGFVGQREDLVELLAVG